jgi:hypothetical protein
MDSILKIIDVPKIANTSLWNKGFICPMCKENTGEGENTYIFDTSDIFYLYCPACNIIFGLGCSPWNESSDRVNAKLISNFTDPTGVNHTGMPVFKNYENMKTFFDLFKFELKCACGIEDCADKNLISSFLYDNKVPFNSSDTLEDLEKKFNDFRDLEKKKRIENLKVLIEDGVLYQNKDGKWLVKEKYYKHI